MGKRLDGNTSTSCTATSGAVVLTYVYDRAERLTTVKEGSGALRTLKSFTFLGNSKLQTATRSNYVFTGATPHTVDVKHTYTYSGRNGRVSSRQTDVLLDGGLINTFNQTWVYDALGEVTSLGYPQCSYPTACPATPRTVTNTYTKGRLTAVSGYASSITYQPNGMIDQVVHTNGVTWTQTADLNGMARPRSYTTSGVTNGNNWATGAYAYDGAGNIKAIGNNTYYYDLVSRLKSSTTYSGGSPYAQSFTYDAVGNLHSLTPGVTVSTSTTTNRLNSPSTYDAPGNMTSWNGTTTYQYGPFNEMWHMVNGAEDWDYLYDTDEQRIWSFRIGGTESRWVLRDLDGRVLREYLNTGTWTWDHDYIYRGSQLLATQIPAGVQHLHPDHLGTPRQVTGAAGQQAAFHTYYPYGVEISSSSQDTNRLKFTGHERDFNNLGSGADDLDYMHARFYNGQIGRFLSADIVEGGSPFPQSYDRNSYVLGNPIRYFDPTGLSEIDYCEGLSCSGTVWVTAQDGGMLEGVSYFSLQQLFGHSQKRVKSPLLTAVAGLTELVAMTFRWFSYEPEETCISSASGTEEICGALQLGIMPLGPGGNFTSEKLLANALGPYRQNLTNAGRALTKHPELIGHTKDSLRLALRTPSEINEAASRALANILRGTPSRITVPRFGEVIEFRGTDGFGARFYAETGNFIGFVSP